MLKEMVQKRGRMQIYVAYLSIHDHFYVWPFFFLITHLYDTFCFLKVASLFLLMTRCNAHRWKFGYFDSAILKS